MNFQGFWWLQFKDGNSLVAIGSLKLSQNEKISITGRLQFIGNELTIHLETFLLKPNRYFGKMNVKEIWITKPNAHRETPGGLFWNSCWISNKLINLFQAGLRCQGLSKNRSFTKAWFKLWSSKFELFYDWSTDKNFDCHAISVSCTLFESLQIREFFDSFWSKECVLACTKSKYWKFRIFENSKIVLTTSL